MLEGLDQIDWRNIQHCYGSAEDFPDLIRALASPDSAVRREAHDRLFNYVWHQGTVYEATACVIPFLIELLTYSAEADKDMILDLLSAAAMGSGYLEAHGDLEIFRRIRQAADYEATLEKEQRIVTAVFDAAAAGVETYLMLLDDPDPHVRVQSAALLPRCADQAIDVAQRLQARIVAESEAVAKAEMVSSLVNIWLFPGFRPGPPLTLSDEQLGYLTRLLRATDEPLAVRFTAACRLLEQHHLELLPEALPLFQLAVETGWTTSNNQTSYGASDAILKVAAALHDQPRTLLDWLLDQMKRPDEDVQITVLFAVENICQKWRWAVEIAAPGILRLLKGDSDKLRLHAAAGFARFGKAAGIASDALRQAMHDNNPVTSKWATDAYKQISGEAQPYALSAWLDKDPPQQDTVPNLMERVRKRLEIDTDFDKELHALIRGLELHGQAAQSAIPLLEQALDHGDIWVRIKAARALWAIDGANSAKTVLPILLADLRPYPLALLVIDCFRQMGEYAQAAVPLLTRIAHDDRRFIEDILLDEALQDMAANALTSIRGHS